MLENAVSRITSVSGSASLIFFRYREAVGVGKAVIEQHQVDAVAMLLERLSCRRRLNDPVAFLGQPDRSTTNE